MLDWLKEKFKPTPDSKAAKALREEFKDLEDAQHPKLAERLTDFVLTGNNESAVAEVTAMPNTQSAILMKAGFPDEKSGLPLLVTKLPPDPDLFLRLAQVYYAAYQHGNSSIVLYYTRIPAIQTVLPWLECFLVELSHKGQQKTPFFPASLLVAMIKASGADPDILVRGPFFHEDPQGNNKVTRWGGAPLIYFVCLDGFKEVVLNSPNVVRDAFRQKEAASRAGTLRALVALQIPLEPFAKEIAALAVGNSKEVRETCAGIISQSFSAFKSLLEGHAEQGSADERYHAIRLLTRHGGEAEHEFLKQRLEVEKSAKVVEVIREAVASTAVEPAVEEDFDLPAVPKVPVKAPLDKQVLESLRQCWDKVERDVAAEFAANRTAQQHGWQRTPLPPDLADQLFEALETYVAKDVDVSAKFTAVNSMGIYYRFFQSYQPHPQFELIHVVRLCLLLAANAIDKDGNVERWAFSYGWSRWLHAYQRNRKEQIDLRKLAAVFRAIGVNDLSIGRSLLETNRFTTSPLFGSDPNAIWPYFAERPELLEEALGLKQRKSTERVYWEQEVRQNAFRVLKFFPRLPAQFVPLLWDLALGSSKTERPFAQDCLDKVPNKEEKIIAALASRQQDARFAAAQWLGNLQHKDAIPALRAALAKEKSETVKDEMIKSLETLGVKLEEILDLKLDKEAEKGLKKGIPKDLDWFPFAQLPPVTWADSGEQVAPEIIHWFLVQAYKLKTAEAGPTLRRYCSLFKRDEREQLGKFVLETWIAQDTKPKYTAEQAAGEAQKQASQTAAFAKQYPQYYPDFDEQRVYQTSFNWLVIQPEGSQTNTKGILALAGACCGGAAAPIVHRYIKQWYGHRAAQCKALLQVLAWIDDRSATQVVLSVANRFRTKGIQEEAVRLCQMLAERKGWTVDELADRTIPTAGFDETGSMELDFGARKFTATLSPEMTITVTNQNGKVISSLPDANQSDDAELAKQSKSGLSNARKELKSILPMQKDRLYEALCTQRIWRFDDWDTYLRQHPIVGRFCQRLVWVAYDGDNIVESFRPLADGTLTNHQDDQITLKSDNIIRLAHQETLPAADCTAWVQHLSDYEIEPLFQQFGKTTFSLPEHMKEEREIKDFLGHVMPAFSLRNRLTKLGYVRGAAQDAGWFYEYRKTFLSLGLEAVIQFTGNFLPEENRTVALERLYFTRKLPKDVQFVGEELALGDLPRVLLSECWNDLRMAAAEGPGFAEDWQEQTRY